jgi:hypothetical protein
VKIFLSGLFEESIIIASEGPRSRGQKGWRENRHLSCEEEAPSCSLFAVCEKGWCLTKSACQ